MGNVRKFKPVVLLVGCAILAMPLAAQQAPVDLLQAERVLEEDAVEVVSSPVIQPIGEDFLDDDFAGKHDNGRIMEWSDYKAKALLQFVQKIGADGLNPADYHPGALQAAIEIGEGAELNAVASETFTWLVEDLRDGRTPMASRKQWFVVDPDADLLPTRQIMSKALGTDGLSNTLVSLNPTHPDYRALKTALASTPDADSERGTAIRANMDRWRWLARDLGGQYLITNVPEYQLRLTVNDKIIRTYRTVVGKPGRTATPQLAEVVEGIVFNPTWTVPQSIVKGEGLGNRVLNNPNWAKSRGYKATKSKNGYISVVQQPGPNNSLGMMKLDMPNAHAIFLHDTPSRHLFKNTNRALSHGCIRTERALELAMTVAILGQGATKEEAVKVATSGKYTRLKVKKTLPVYITYFTMGVDIDGNLRSFPDIYKRDAPVLAALGKSRIGNRARKMSEKVVAIEAPGA